MSWYLDQLRALGVPAPKVFVETGAYLGRGIAEVLAAKHFAHMHSIELSPKWHQHCTDLYKDDDRVTVHLGDSAEVLARLLEAGALPREPILFYLDAHWSGGPTAGIDVDGGCPVLRELEVLKKYRGDVADVVVIDDMRLMGKATWSGQEGDPVYPRTYFDFRHATRDAMTSLFEHKRVAETQRPDRLIFY